MTNGMKIFAILLPLLVILSACASNQPPQPDPVSVLREDVTLLQKQLLELQKQQNESAVAIDTLSARLRSIEGKQTAKAPAASAGNDKKQTVTGKKKSGKQPAKKKKKTRRQP